MASPSSRTATDEAHEAEVETQLKIADEVGEAPAAPVEPEVPAADEAPVEQEVAKVTLRSKNVEQYPLTVSVVGTDDLVFDNEGSTVEVDSQVAEQIAYSPVVEVAE